MAEKRVKITGIQDDKFRMEITAGNHTLVVDQPRPIGGGDSGPNPLEYFLVSLAGCIGAIGRIIANQRKMHVQGFRVDVDGELNTDNLLGISSEERAGYRSIKVSVHIDAEMTEEEKASYLSEIDSRCPISDNICNLSNVRFELV